MKAFFYCPGRAVGILQTYIYIVRHKNWIFKNKNSCGHRLTNHHYLTRLWYLLTFTLFNLCTVFQPKGIWVGGTCGGRGGDDFVVLHHCPIWRRGPRFCLVVFVNYYITINIFANTNRVVLLFISMPFCGDWYRCPHRVIPDWPRISVILQSFI